MTRRRFTPAEAEVREQIRRQGWITASTGSYRTGRGVGPYGSLRLGVDSKNRLVRVPCWCEAHERWEPLDDVAAGRTWQCARRDCHEPGKPRPTTLNGNHSDVVIRYEEPLKLRPPLPPWAPLTQPEGVIDPDWEAAIQITGADTYEGLQAVCIAAHQAGIEGNFRNRTIWYANQLMTGNNPNPEW